MERYDIAIVGSGPAGLSAALNAKIRNKKFIIFGNKELSHKLSRLQKLIILRVLWSYWSTS